MNATNPQLLLVLLNSSSVLGHMIFTLANGPNLGCVGGVGGLYS